MPKNGYGKPIIRFTALFGSILTVILLVGVSPVYSVNSVPESEETTDAIEASKQFEDLKKSLNDNQTDLSKSLVSTSLLEQRLSEVSDEITTLEDQLKNIDDDLAKTQNRIVITTREIKKNEERITELSFQIEELNSDIEKQKLDLSSLLQIIYFESESAGFFDSYDTQTIKLLLNNDDANNVLERAESLSLLEFNLSDLVKKLDANLKKLIATKAQLEFATKSLKDLRTDLKEEKLYLVLQKKSKENLLTSTKGQETIYKELIKKAKEEQIQLRKEIVDLVIKYSEDKKQLNRDGFATDNFDLTTGGDKLSFPISPSLGISAYFRDPAYKAALGMEHNAVDIRAKQGTIIHAPADGIVMKVNGGEGTNYHYIILGHNGGIMTLYGHVFDEFVKEGEKVKRGDAIGLSGGMPGSKGAGWLTTGPHLHFEVFADSAHVDPMDYLDLSELPDKFKE